ncbi:MAG: hypothetical protein IJM98_04310, partial [Oscillospiraceae bacterium]|nr:hypothetical protein [Oscillospiraceae bacterium]
MSNFFDYFKEDIGQVFQAFVEVLSSIFNFLNYLFNFPMRMNIIKEHSEGFGTTDWIMLLIANVMIIAICCLIIYFVGKLIRSIFFGGISKKEYERMSAEVRTLQRDLLRSNYEKDKILAMKMGDRELPPEEEENPEEEGEEGAEENSEETAILPSNRNTFDSPCVNPADSRFFRLTNVDNFYKTEYVKPEYDNDITLEQFCEQFRKFAASQLKLYYDLDMMRYFVASMGTSRIIILQGISGTGKTSLPYAFGKFVQSDTTVVSVQPSWRERTELYGYFNEFTKRYSETEFLQAIYECNYYRDPHIVILDEMNIARV